MKCLIRTILAHLQVSHYLFPFFQLTFSEFDIESHVTCAWDSVTIRNGGSPSSPIIGQFCGNSNPRTVQSGSNQLVVIFNSDHSVQNGGFLATWNTQTLGKTWPASAVFFPYYSFNNYYQIQKFFCQSIRKLQNQYGFFSILKGQKWKTNGLII